MGVRVEQLVKRYAGSSRPTLDALSLEIPKGATAAILGPSGAGKSTLLRCLTGLEPFDEGNAHVAGIALTPTRGRSPGTDLSRLQGRIGLVFQSFELFPHLSVLDNCTLAPRQVRGEPSGQASDRARGLLERLGLGERIHAFPEALSGGQKQRVAIARALAMEPRVLFYDEPTSALDPGLRGEVGATIREVAKGGLTQVLVTHDLAFARETADVAFLLAQGRIQASGEPSVVTAEAEREHARRAG